MKLKWGMWRIPHFFYVRPVRAAHFLINYMYASYIKGACFILIDGNLFVVNSVLKWFYHLQYF